MNRVRSAECGEAGFTDLKVSATVEVIGTVKGG